MSYEEYVNGEAMELTEEETVTEVAEESAEEAVTEVVEEPAEEVIEEIAEVLAEETVEATEESAEVPAEAVEAEDEVVEIEFSVEEPLTEPTVDEDLYDASAAEEFEVELEMEEDETPACACNTLQAKCDELRTACKDVITRLSNDLEMTDYNPYIRSTTTYRYEILKKSTDTEPVDVFEFQRTSGFSLRAMAITSVLVAAADVAVGKIIKKKLLKK